MFCLVLYLDAATLAFATTALILIYGPHHEPWKIAVFGGFASAVGSMTQLLGLRWILKSGRPWMRRFAPSREKVEATLREYPSASFLALTVARATPLPDAPLKIVAAVIGYSVLLYGLATYLGSMPYYFVLAYIGRKFEIPLPWVIGAFAVIGIGILIDRWRRRRRRVAA